MLTAVAKRPRLQHGHRHLFGILHFMLRWRFIYIVVGVRVGTLFDVAKYKSDLKHLNNNHINDSQRKIRNGLAQMRFAIQIKWIQAADLWIVAENEANKNKQTTD